MAGLIDQLCLKCGMCCNGVLFADVRRERGDFSPLFRKHGSPVPQPCPAFKQATCRCAVYRERPARCRKFECQQLLAVRAGDKTPSAALKKIRAARRLAAKAGKLLAELKFNDSTLSLDRRFEQCQRAAERGHWSSAQLCGLARLQLAMHQLSLLLGTDFYPA